MEKSEVKTQPTIQKDNEIILLFLDMYEHGIKRGIGFIADAKNNLTKMLKSETIDQNNETIRNIYEAYKKRKLQVDDRITKIMLKK